MKNFENYRIGNFVTYDCYLKYTYIIIISEDEIE